MRLCSGNIDMYSVHNSFPFSIMSRRLLTIVLITALAILALVNYQKRMELSKELERLSVQTGQAATGSNAEEMAQAKAIVEKVKQHILLSGDVEPTVAKIVDSEALRKQNAFYANAKNGDYLVVTPLRAVLYDPDADIILDVIPVQLQPVQNTSSSKASQ